MKKIAMIMALFFCAVLIFCGCGVNVTDVTEPPAVSAATEPTISAEPTVPNTPEPPQSEPAVPASQPAAEPQPVVMTEVWKEPFKAAVAELKGSDIAQYALYDVTGDGQPELLIKKSESGYDLKFYICELDAAGKLTRHDVYAGNFSLAGVQSENTVLVYFKKMGHETVLKVVRDGNAYKTEEIVGRDLETPDDAMTLSELKLYSYDDPAGLEWKGNAPDTNGETIRDFAENGMTDTFKKVLLRLGNAMNACYTLYDTTGDGRPEMIVKFGNSEADMLITVYEYDGRGNALPSVIGGGHTSVCGTAQPGAILLHWTHQGYENLTKLVYENGSYTGYSLLEDKEADEKGYLALEPLTMYVFENDAGFAFAGNPQNGNAELLRDFAENGRETVFKAKVSCFGDGAEYALYDVTGDGKPELIVRTGEIEAEKLTLIFQYSEDGVITKTELPGSHTMIAGLESEGTLLFSVCHMGVESLYKLKNNAGELTLEPVYTDRIVGDLGYTEFDWLKTFPAADPAGFDFTANPRDTNAEKIKID